MAEAVRGARNNPGPNDRKAVQLDVPDLEGCSEGRPARSAVFILLCLIVLLVPLLFSPWTTECGRLKTLALHLAVVAGLSIMALHVAAAGAARITSAPLHSAVAAYTALVCLSTLLSPYPWASLNELWRTAMFVGLYAMTAYSVRSIRAIWIVAVLCAVATALVCGYGVAQRMGHDVVTYSQSPQDRLFSSIGNPNMLAGFLILMFWTLAGMALDTRGKLPRIALAAVCGLALWCLVFTYTKGAWIAFALTGLLVVGWVAWGRGLPYHVNPKPRLLLVAGLALVLLAAFAVFHRPILGRLYTLRDSSMVRSVYWSGALGVIREHPILGSGAGTFHIVYPDKRPPDFRAAGATYNTLHAHCEPLEILTELGVVGLLAFGWVVVAFYRTLAQAIAAKTDGVPKGLLLGVGVGMTGLLLHNLVDVNLRWYTTPTFFWLFLGLATAARRLAQPDAAPALTLTIPLRLAPRVALALCLVAVLCAAAKVRILDTFASEIDYRKSSDLARRGEWKSALAHADAAIEKDPANLRAHYQQAYCYYEQKMYGEALRSYLHLEVMSPNFCQLQYNMAVLYSLMGRWEEASERFVRAEKMGVAPEGFSSAAMLAKLAAKGGDAEKRMAILERLAEANPSDPLGWNRAGISHYEKGDLDKASQRFQKALAADPNYVPALNNMAGVLYRRKAYRDAIAMCERILTINPKAAKARVNLGRACYLSGDKPRAAAEWRKVLQDDPSEPEAQACLAAFDKTGPPADKGQ